MNVTVFGATGGVGRLVVDELRGNGHRVTAYVRSPAKVPDSWGDEVTVVVGELTDIASVDRVVEGADAVVSAVGPSLDRSATGHPLVEGTRAIVDAMRRHRVRRYVGIATASVPDPRDRAAAWRPRTSTLMARTFRRRAHDELVGMCEVVMASGLDWTTVRFIHPQDGPPLGRFRHGFYGRTKLGSRITRADLAAFTAAQVDDPTYVHSRPAVSN